MGGWKGKDGLPGVSGATLDISGAPAARREVDLHRLAEAVRAIERRRFDAPGDEAPSSRFVRTAWGPVDQALNHSPAACGLARACLHEWLGPAPHDSAPPARAQTVSIAHARAIRREARRWSASLCLLAHLAWRAVDTAAESGAPGRVFWIGRRCWAHPRLLVRGRAGADQRLLRASLFVDPPDDASRLWAIDLALRCAGACAVIADGSRLDMSATRRLQLASEAGGALALLARPPTDCRELSAGATRWLVRRRAASDTHRAPGWSVELLRCKGVQPAPPPGAARRWDLEWDRAQGSVRASADVVDRSGAQARPPALAPRRALRSA